LCDGQTDGQTELRWLRRATAVAAVARENDTQMNKKCKYDSPNKRGDSNTKECYFFVIFWPTVYINTDGPHLCFLYITAVWWLLAVSACCG